MTRMGGSTSKGLGRRAFGTAGGWGTPSAAPERRGEVIDLAGEILRKPIALPALRAWKPRAGRIYNFPVRILPEEK